MLDQHTLLVGYSITSLILSFGLVVAARAQRRFRGLELWGWAGLLMGTIPLQIAARGVSPLAPPAVVVHLTVLSAVLCLRIGMSRYTEQPLPRRRYQVALLAWLLAELLLIAAGARLSLRAGLLGVLLSGILFDTGRQLARSPRLWALVTHRITAGLCYTLAVGTDLRAVVIMIHGRGTLAFGPTLVNPFAVLLFQVLQSTLGMSLMMMVWARLDQELQEHVDHLEDQIVRDPLTGALNRRGLERAAHQFLAGSFYQDRPLSVICLDIDHFKQVNDRYGHGVGDVVLQRVVGAIQPHLRARDQVARMGGEEFAVFLPGLDLEAAALLAERLRRAMEEISLPVPRGPLRFTCSFGVSARSSPHEDLTSLLSRADTALYAAKRAGRNRVCHSEADLLAPA
jgi:diguanylate cyclase (GGDEF)-like protein